MSRFATLAVQAGREPDPSTGAVVPSLSLSTTFKQTAPGVHHGYEYSRSGNPTRHLFESAIAALEQGTIGVAFSSGCGATMNMLHLIPPKSHVIAMDDLYGGTLRIFNHFKDSFQMDITYCDMTELNNFESLFQPNTKMVWVETPTNPMLKIVDIEAVVNITKKISPEILVIVDNTFLSPYFQKPLLLGADIVVHSVTKYLNGHSDVVMGAVVMGSSCPSKVIERLRYVQNATGATPSPFDCFLAARGLQTLHVRMQRHASNAFAVAVYLERSPYVRKVIYPGLPSHPQHDIAQKQQEGFGGMVSFEIGAKNHTSETEGHVIQFIRHLRLITLAESLGAVESLIEIPALMTHGTVNVHDREKLGMSSSLIRLSVGIEDEQDLIEDLDQALNHAFAFTNHA